MRYMLLYLIIILSLLTPGCQPAQQNNVTSTPGGTATWERIPQGAALVALPQPGYIFAYWQTEAVIILDNPLIVPFPVPAIEAVFIPVDIQAVASPPEGGTILIGEPQENREVSLVATPNPGYRFSHWSEGGNPFHDQASLTFVPARHRFLAAVFTPLLPGLSTDPLGSGVVRIFASPADQRYQFQAIPLPGYVFSHWQEDGQDLDAPKKLEITGRIPGDITAVFTPGLTPIDGSCILAPVSKQVNLFNVSPQDLHPIPPWLAGGRENLRLRQEPLTHLVRMGHAAQEDGITIKVISAYRSNETQAAIFRNSVRQHGQEVARLSVALPGQSEHQLGTTVDFGEAGYDWAPDFGNTRQGQWLQRNAWKFGFVMSYPPGSTEVTGYIYEPWHFRYVGLEHAEAIATQGIIPQVYLEDLYYQRVSNPEPSAP